MEEYPSYITISQRSKNILQKFKENGDVELLMKEILEELEEIQNTLTSKLSKRSRYKGILKRYFTLTDEQFKPLEWTMEENDGYNKQKKVSLGKHTICIVTQDLIDKIRDIEVLDLMLLSGRRLSEIISNKVQYLDGVI